MNKLVINIVSYIAWSMMIAFGIKYACNLNDIMVNYWSVVLVVNCLYMFATPIMSTAKEE